MTAPADDRVVLPLALTRTAADRLCRVYCWNPLNGRPNDGHEADCLVPLLNARDELLEAAPELHRVSGDCLDPVKHVACSGCACSCHRHHNRGKSA